MSSIPPIYSIRFFVQGAVNVYNFHRLTVVGCLFEHNGPASFLKLTNFRGHSGALSVSLHNYTSPFPVHEITVNDTVFYNNSAMPNEDVRQSTSEVFNKFIFTGRGGALGLFLSDDSSIVRAVISNCTFEDNTALTWGGGAYFVLDYTSNHSIAVKDCTFLRNACVFGAGALFTGFFGSGTTEIHSSVTVLGSYFIENSAPQGGAVTISLPGYQGMLYIV